MDIGEKIFGLVSNWRRRRLEENRFLNRYDLQDCEKALALVVQPFFEEPVEIHPAKQSGVCGGAFYLPATIHFFRDREKNRDLYLHQILMLAGAQHLALAWPTALAEESERTRYYAEKKERITEAVARIYPYFREFQTTLLQAFTREVDSHTNPWLLWGGLSSGTISASARWDQKRDERPPSRQKNERNLETSFEREEVDLDKEQHNPVTHSFEKMETADEYQGGSRTTDGSDQLSDHEEALKELKLNKVTRSGETAAAFLSSDYQHSSNESLNGLSAAENSPRVLFYPEWHYKKKTFLKNYCRLWLSTAENATTGGFRERLLQEQKSRIEHYKKRLQQVCNQRKWKSQQLEGSEIDIDSFVRHLTDVRNQVPSSGRMYLNQLRQARDYQVLVLVDLSLSTDSYVENRRVLDVELEAVGLMGLLAESDRDNTIVAGTFSETRHRCVFEYLKQANEGWSAFYKRAPAVVPRGYTRLAPAIRHATEILSASSAKSKILILLTDGKPTDYDGYEGRYGIEDIHKACMEASQRRILTKAFAIEKNAKHYFPRMFPSYEILASAEKLPASLVKILFEARSG